MTQSTPNDKSRKRDDEEPTSRELVEALASAYFNACRKIARALNRTKSGRR